MILSSPLSPLAPLFRLFSLLTALSLLWHRRWLALGMTAASVLAVPIIIWLARLMLSAAAGMVVRGMRSRTSLI